MRYWDDYIFQSNSFVWAWILSWEVDCLGFTNMWKSLYYCVQTCSVFEKLPLHYFPSNASFVISLHQSYRVVLIIEIFSSTLLPLSGLSWKREMKLSLIMPLLIIIHSFKIHARISRKTIHVLSFIHNYIHYMFNRPRTFWFGLYNFKYIVLVTWHDSTYLKV